MIYFAADINGLPDLKVDSWKCLFGNDIEFISPYQLLGKHNVECSYESFTNLIGLDRYSNYVLEKVQNHTESNLILIGESIGATALWMISEQLADNVTMFCLYGSRIREYLETDPHCEVNLIFSNDEQYFYNDLLKATERKQKVVTEMVKAKHGFATPGNPHFSDRLFTEITNKIKSSRDRGQGSNI